MEASLLDMTRGHGLPVFALAALDPTALEVEIELVPGDDDDDETEPWFVGQEDVLAAGEDQPFPPIATRQSLYAMLGFATVVALATFLYGATL